MNTRDWPLHMETIPRKGYRHARAQQLAFNDDILNSTYSLQLILLPQATIYSL